MGGKFNDDEKCHTFYPRGLLIKVSLRLNRDFNSNNKVLDVRQCDGNKILFREKINWKK